VLLDLDLLALLDVQRVVHAELIFPRAVLDGASDSQAVRELVELHVLDLDGDEHVLALPARVPHLVVLALDAAVGVARHEVPGFEDVREVPEVVEALGDERDALAAALDPPALLQLHT